MQASRINNVSTKEIRWAMYICICNAIRECELRTVARCTGGDAEGVYAALGKKPNCGQCLEEAEALIFEARESARPDKVAA